MVSLKKFWSEIKEECSKHVFRSHGRWVFVDDDALLEHFGVPPSVPGACVLRVGRRTPYIVINATTRDSSKEFRDAVILHEIGHIVSGHLVKQPHRMDAMEFEADLYAQQQGADMVGALKHLISLNVYDNVSLNRRINFLESRYV